MAAYCEDDNVSGNCGRCGRSWYFIGCDARRIVKLIRKLYGEKLCDLCREAEDRGFYQFMCEACSAQCEGSYEDVKLQLNLRGRALCRACRQAFYGTYNPENPALTAVLAFVPPKKKRPWRTIAEWEALQLVAGRENKYHVQVRNLSRRHLRTNPELINPLGRTIGRSGMSGAHHLDHIVPISVCWAHEVAVEDAASPHNLQVVPWILNMSRIGSFKPEEMIGWPGS